MRLACSDKGKYATPEEAGRVASACSKARKKYLRVYACPQCGMFHLTSEKPMPPKRRTSP